MNSRTLYYVGIAAIIVGVVAGMLMLSSCSVFESACTKAVPTLTEAQSLIADAALALQEAEDAVATLPPADREKALAAIAAARTTLRAAAATMVVASTSCSSPTLGEVFASFAQAWAAIRPFVALLGGTGAAQVREPMAANLH